MKGLRTTFVMFGLLINAAASQADPLILMYDVEVWFRYSYLTQTETLFRPPPFTLSVTLDPRVVSSTSYAGFAAKDYGSVSFSTIPLVVPPIPAHLPLATSTSTHQQWRVSDREDGTFEHYGTARVNTETVQPDDHGAEYRSGTMLTLFAEGLATPPFLSAVELARFLGRPFPFDEMCCLIDRHLNFALYGSFFDFERQAFSADSFAYYGVARLIEGAGPVPEPSSLALLTSALAVGAIRRWRGRVRPRNANHGRGVDNLVCLYKHPHRLV
jgi:hypothetical protein